MKLQVVAFVLLAAFVASSLRLLLSVEPVRPIAIVDPFTNRIGFVEMTNTDGGTFRLEISRRMFGLILDVPRWTNADGSPALP